MEQRLSVVTLGVADLERSRRFYEDGLGWRRGNDHAEVVFFQTGGAVLALYPRHLLAEDAEVANDGQGFDGVTLAYCTRTREEVDAVLAQAATAGARILKPARGTFWGGCELPCLAPTGFTRSLMILCHQCLSEQDFDRLGQVLLRLPCGALRLSLTTFESIDSCRQLR